MDFSLDINFVKKFKLRDLKLINVDHWLISLRPDQPTIGSLVLTLNRPCERLSMLTSEEGKSLAKAYTVIEDLLENTFKAQKVNYLALMMFDEQVHFHVLPRYENPVLFNGKSYKDSGWPGPPSLEALELEDVEIHKLHNYMKEKV